MTMVAGHQVPTSERVTTSAAGLPVKTLPSADCAAFVSIAAMNPCHCGYFGDPRRACSCAAGSLSRYQTSCQEASGVSGGGRVGRLPGRRQRSRRQYQSQRSLARERD
ncbi:MAG TPA: ATP-binding protein [Thermomicrobiales bacterium]|nr:ATP-binding protein [Thermomicrobiales bacterium]